jgi:hypothetical protein
MTLIDRRLALRARVNHSANLLALGSAILVFSSGLVLLTHFHAGAGILRASGLGHSRLVWVNLHRLSSLVFLAAVAVHVQLHWRPVVAQFGRWSGRTPGKFPRVNRVLYFGFAVVSVTGLTAWFAVSGSPPLFGPVMLRAVEPRRLFWIDLHHWSGLILLPAVVIHVRGRFRSIRRAIGWRAK